MEIPAKSITRTRLIRSSAICEFWVSEKKSEKFNFRKPMFKFTKIDAIIPIIKNKQMVLKEFLTDFTDLRR